MPATNAMPEATPIVRLGSLLNELLPIVQNYLSPLITATTPASSEDRKDIARGVLRYLDNEIGLNLRLDEWDDLVNPPFAQALPVAIERKGRKRKIVGEYGWQGERTELLRMVWMQYVPRCAYGYFNNLLVVASAQDKKQRWHGIETVDWGELDPIQRQTVLSHATKVKRSLPRFRKTGVLERNLWFSGELPTYLNEWFGWSRSEVLGYCLGDDLEGRTAESLRKEEERHWKEVKRLHRRLDRGLGAPGCPKVLLDCLEGKTFGVWSRRTVSRIASGLTFVSNSK